MTRLKWFRIIANRRERDSVVDMGARAKKIILLIWGAI